MKKWSHGAEVAGRLMMISLISQLAGCVSYRVGYTPAYVPQTQAGGAQIEGKALLYIDPSDENYVFTGRPSSLTGGGSTLVIPLGKINKEIALAALGGLFSRCEAADTRDGAAGYVAVIQSRVVSYDYQYNSLRNLTFAVTPQVDLTIQINLFDPQCNPYFTKTYATGTYSGHTVLDTLKPAELVNKTTHEAIAGLYAQAAADIAAQVRSRRASSPAEVKPAVAVAPKPASQAQGQTSAERLKELKRLYDDGLITKEAYEKKQQEILNSL